MLVVEMLLVVNSHLWCILMRAVMHAVNRCSPHELVTLLACGGCHLGELTSLRVRVHLPLSPGLLGNLVVKHVLLYELLLPWVTRRQPNTLSSVAAAAH